MVPSWFLHSAALLNHLMHLHTLHSFFMASLMFFNLTSWFLHGAVLLSDLMRLYALYGIVNRLDKHILYK